ncbi:hypothetical protein [uncultured Methanobrevibacter sp.]|uniref:hypothetical protein n=1 Tax=uncultured Methanobrevibacter sp. TaxID=253161 RepID=UPI0026059819|nr:hypothetical protein [uncultured Methanobrevibacter sp.]
MKIPPKSKSYMIPEYSLTGDLLSYITCGLQYRYQNKGALPPSKPVQRWFGEFIHGVMEESFNQWKFGKKEFPWDWKDDIRPIEDEIDLRLQVRGLYPHDEDLFFSINQPGQDLKREDLNEHDHKKLASARAEKAINIWGEHLFPLIDSAELLIKGLRPMPNYDKNISRSNYYGINGVVDVLTSTKINRMHEERTSANNNKIVNFIKSNIKENSIGEYEIIIDYKGMKRPPIKVADPLSEDKWENHKQQILTYSWLRSKQEDAKDISAGIILYLNELVPSKEDLMMIKEEIRDNLTDVPQNGEFEKDVETIENWKEEDKAPELSDEFKIARSIRFIEINDKEKRKALKKFDNVVCDIENSLIREMKGCKIQDAWKAEADKRTCLACDFKTFCKHNSDITKNI